MQPGMSNTVHGLAEALTVVGAQRNPVDFSATMAAKEKGKAAFAQCSQIPGVRVTFISTFLCNRF